MYFYLNTHLTSINDELNSKTLGIFKQTLKIAEDNVNMVRTKSHYKKMNRPNTITLVIQLLNCLHEI